MSCAGPFRAESVARERHANLKKTGQRAGEASRQHHSAPEQLELPPPPASDANDSRHQAGLGSDTDPLSLLRAHVQTQLLALNVHTLLRSMAKTLEASPPTTTMRPQAPTKDRNSELGKPTIVLQLPGVRLAVLTNAYDSLLHLDITLSSAASLLIATYIACMLTWHVLSFCITLLVNAAAFVILTSATFMGCTMLSMNAPRMTASVHPTAKQDSKSPMTVAQLPLLRVDGSVLSPQSTHVGKTDEAAATKRKEAQAPAARRRVLAHLNRNRLLVNVVPGDTRRRADMLLGEANIRVGKAFLQAVPGKRKPRDIYVVRVDCGAQSGAHEKHMNPVIMWDVTATFAEFKKLEHDLKKEVKAKKETRGVKVPHVSSGAVLFVQPELTEHVLNARRARLQTFIDTVRSDPVLSTTMCLRKFCQAY